MHRLLHLSDAACQKILTDRKLESIDAYKPSELRERLRNAREIERLLIADRAWFLRKASENDEMVESMRSVIRGLRETLREMGEEAAAKADKICDTLNGSARDMQIVSPVLEEPA